MNDLPSFLSAFSEGHLWVVPAYTLFSGIVSALDASFFTEEFKSSWPKPIRMIWDTIAMNIGKSRNAGSAG
jgi:hypothetical protein|tara:strand:+ start:306 stop:518 length:213 start_codon:yes stop_codon:yes gene_type:complete